MSKRVSSSCERNQQPIFEQLSIYLNKSKQLLEIGSGTGQHAVFFAAQLPHVVWHTSDMPENHPSIRAWISESGCENISEPVAFKIGQDEWPCASADAVFTANTTHIMQIEEAQLMMEMVAKHLPQGGVFCQYGPMKVDGDFTSDSNRVFDESLKQKGFGGIRDIEQLANWGKGLELNATIAMPANNFLLVWKKQ